MKYHPIETIEAFARLLIANAVSLEPAVIALAIFTVSAVRQ